MSHIENVQIHAPMKRPSQLIKLTAIQQTTALSNAVSNDGTWNLSSFKQLTLAIDWIGSNEMKGRVLTFKKVLLPFSFTWNDSIIGSPRKGWIWLLGNYGIID